MKSLDLIHSHKAGIIRFLKLVFLFIVFVVMMTGLFQYDKLSDYIISHVPERLIDTIIDEPPPEKIWLHRVNSTEKQIEFANKYQGFEFDIIFYPEERSFENSHEKTGNFKKYNLADQLSTYAQYNSGKGLWLDLKNLTEGNKINIKAALDVLLDKYRVDKDKIWLESPNWKALGYFRQAGYHTSYYLPYYKLSKMSASETSKARKETMRAALSGNIDAISFPSSAQDDYYHFLENLKLPDNIVFLTWHENKYYKVFLLESGGKALLKNNRIKVILLKDMGHFHR